MSAATLCELLYRGLEGPDRISLWTPARSLSSRQLWRASACMAHRFAKPCVPRVCSEPWVPYHQEMKWT